MKKRILLVDDSSTSRLASRMLFANHDSYELISSCDGRDGVEAAVREHPDLILMDIEMPRMTGLEACRLLKQNDVTKHIPVIFLTMRGEEPYVREGLASGGSDFLTKPMNEQKLIAVLKKHLRE